MKFRNTENVLSFGLTVLDTGLPDQVTYPPDPNLLCHKEQH